MRIKLGTDDEGHKIWWDSAVSPLLNVYGGTACGKTRLADAIMRQAGTTMAIIRFGTKDEPMPIPTVMTVDGNNKEKTKEMLESIQAEQQRRTQKISEDTKPVMLVFDDFNIWLNLRAEAEMVRMLTQIMQNCRKTRMCMVICIQSYRDASERLRQLAHNSILCDAGSHLLMRDVFNLDVVRSQNVGKAGSELLHGGNVFESNTGVLMRLEPAA